MPPPTATPASPSSASSPTGGPGPGTPLLGTSSTLPSHLLDGSTAAAAAAEGKAVDGGLDEDDGLGLGLGSPIRRRPASLGGGWRQRLLQWGKRRRRFLFGLGLGQVLSILIALTGVFSSLLARDGASRPTTQSALTYVFLSAYLLKRPRPRAPLQVPWWRYALLVRTLRCWLRWRGGASPMERTG